MMSMRRIRTRCLSALLPVALVAAGCGSSTSTGARTTSRLPAQGSDAVTALRTKVAGELVRFPQLPVPARSQLPSPPGGARTERAYLTALFNDAQSVWRREFLAARVRYKPARLVIFSGVTRSKCGPHEDSGPFYCPVDRSIYFDLRFFSLLLTDSPVGVAAQGYIVGHEVAHNVQRMIGVADLVNAANDRDPGGKNGRSVQVELQADCLAGVWAHSAYPRSGLSRSELADAVKTAQAIGDDYLREAAGEEVDTTLFTHGSSRQRQQWLRVGFQTGRPKACDTFASK
jgi:uncharacterized protein